MHSKVKATPELSDARRALLQRYLRGGMARPETKPATIPKRNAVGPALLSFNQQQVWLHSQVAGEALIYNEPVTIHRHGELDVAALERSFTEIVRRHEAWRTTFEWDGDQAVQIVHPAPEHIEIPLSDLRTHPQPEREAIRLATEDALLPFDLTRGPMYRLRLVRLGDAEHRLFLALHHIIFDGVSLYRVFLPELQTLYAGFVKNAPAVLGELPIQYGDYAVWQRESVKQVLPQQLSYWKTVFEDLPILDLKTDHPRAATETFAGEMETLEISASTADALKALSKEQGVTLFMTMVAGFVTLLHGYTGQEDMVVGTASDGRSHTETEGLLGFFLNTIAIRCAFSKELPFTELLKRVRNATLEALSHDAVPFELLVQKFAGKRDPSRGPLFQVLISIEPPLSPLQDGWGFTQMDVDIRTTKFDLNLELDDRVEGLVGRFIYNTDLFERETINLLKLRWLKLLDVIAGASALRVRDLTEAVWSDEKLDFSAKKHETLMENGSGSAAEQRRAEHHEDEAFWREQLSGELPVLELPSDRPRPAVRSFRSGRAEVLIDETLARQLRETGEQERSSLFVMLVAACKVWLHRLSGQDDLIIGVPLPGGENTNSIIPLRGQVVPAASFTQLLAETKRQVTKAREHHGYFLGDLAKRKLDPSRPLLFDVTFNYESTSVSKSIDGLDLGLNVAEHEGALEIECNYNADLFDGSTVERWLGHFRTLLKAIAANPTAKVGELPLLDDSERDQILNVWNDTAADYPSEKTLHALVEEQTARTPASSAVAFEERMLTYAQLDEQADAFAARLRALGVRPGVLVGVWVERSIEMVVAVLGVLKAGGAYVPMDPDFPTERLRLMIEDAAMPVLVTQRSLVAALPAHRAQIICVDEPGSANSTAAIETQSDDLAYVIFTSGSTGRPKGVPITHRAVVNFLTSMRRRPGLDARDVLLAVTTLSFDIAGLELFLPLTTGAQVVIVSRETASDGHLLAAEIERTGATVMQATPATWRGLLTVGWRGVPRMKILVGGEAVPPDLVAELLPRSREVWNMYGPTETTIWSTVERLENATPPLAIGRPIDNTRAYILNSALEPQPVGLVGELHLAGVGLARGYLNQPDLTSEKFIRDPFNPAADARLYKTGDLARYLPDGRIECLGRLDSQIKLRGFRIERSEIEAVLRSHPAIANAAVVLRHSSSGEPRLVAYCQQRDGASAPESELRRHVSEQLPIYMIPSAFVMLDQLPLTPNGKLDLKALPEDLPTTRSADNLVPAQTPIQAELIGIWEEVLERQPVGITDNFFDLGGHSLLGMRVLTRISHHWNVSLPMRQLFLAPTITDLAAAISSAQSSELGSSSAAAIPQARRTRRAAESKR
jgi:amino acid adenylation domain-containing protein